MRNWKTPTGFAAPASTEPSIRLTCRFISPVFGGGVEPKVFDPITPIRVPSIRGQLRFWWRTTRADLTLPELHAREMELFGGVGGKRLQASAVQIRVIRQAKAPTKLEIFKQGDAFRLIDDRLKALAYGAFPLRGTDAAKKHGMLWQYDDSFELELRVRPPVTETKEGALVSHSNHTKELLEDLHRALWAWLHFGSLGGRTRRGFGAIKLENATGFELKSIKDGWPDASGRKEVEWPVLPASSNAVVFAATPFSRGKDAQELLLGLLHRMRQGDLGRTPSSPRPGRSKWPEPDAIRDRYKITSGRHGKPIHSPRIDVFPRAAFGAPVIFHFKTEPGEREPPDTTLLPYLVQPENTKKPEKVLHRMASSLLLRPHHEPGGMVRPMALRLDHPKPHGWGLAERTRGPEIKLDYRVRNELEDHHAAQIDPLNLDGKITTDPVDNYLKRLAKL